MADYEVQLSRGTVTLPARYEEKLERVAELKRARDQVFPNMYRVAQVLDGGERAVEALTGDNTSGGFRDMPVANYLRDALDALASRLATPPDLRVEPPSTGRKSDDSDARAKAAEKRARIVAHYDDSDELDQIVPQLARWVPGAAYAVATIDPCKVYGYPYPKTTLHSPLDTMLAAWSPIQDPQDCGLTLRVPVRELKNRYPHAAASLDERETASGYGGVLLDRQRDGIGVEVVRYYDRDGTWRLVPSKGLLLDFTANPLESGPSFVAFTKFNYSRLRGEFDDLIGLMISMARLTIMADIAVRKNVTAPVNLFGGEPLSGPYREGFGVTNVFDVNQRVDIPRNSIQFEAWQQIDRFERQLSIEATVPPQDRGEAGMSFVTGRGLNELGSRVTRKVGEYQSVFERGIRKRDGKMLEYDDLVWPDIDKPMAGVRDGTSFSEHYRPSTHIKSQYRTERDYGALAGMEEAAKLNGLSIMAGAGWVPDTWIRRQIPGLRNVKQLEDQLRTQEAEAAFTAMLLTHANDSQSPEHMRALQAVVDMLPAGEMRRIAERWLTERGEETPQDELEALMGQQSPAAALPPPDPATIMSAITAGGAPRGGPQVVRNLAG